MTSQGAPEDGATELLPCPFCNAAIKHVESQARSFNPPRMFHEYHHPRNDCLFFDGIICSFSDDPAPRLKWIAAWNRRAASPSPPPVVGEIEPAVERTLTGETVNGVPVQAWMWEEVVDPTGEIIVGKTVRCIAYHWSTPPANATVTRLVNADALSAPPVGVEVVKLLEWRPAGDDGRRWYGNAPIPPHYQVRDNVWWRVNDSLRFHEETMEAAKSAAQADFERRIRSALVPSLLLKEAEEALRETEIALAEICFERTPRFFPMTSAEIAEAALKPVRAALARLGAAP